MPMFSATDWVGPRQDLAATVNADSARRWPNPTTQLAAGCPAIRMGHALQERSEPPVPGNRLTPTEARRATSLGAGFDQSINTVPTNRDKDKVLDHRAGSFCVGPKRRHVSSEYADGLAAPDRPAAKKPRTQEQRFPGAHAEAWHKSRDVPSRTDASSCVDMHLSAAARHHSAWEPQPFTMPIVGEGLPTLYNAVGDAIMSMGSRWPSDEVNCMLSWPPGAGLAQPAQDPSFPSQTPSAGTDLGMLNYYEPLPKMAPASVDFHIESLLVTAPMGMEFPESGGERATSFPPLGMWANDTAQAPGPLIGTSGSTWLTQTEGLGLPYNPPPSVLGDTPLLPPPFGAAHLCRDPEAQRGSFSTGHQGVSAPLDKAVSSVTVHTPEAARHPGRAQSRVRSWPAQQLVPASVSNPQDRVTACMGPRAASPQASYTLPWRLAHDALSVLENGHASAPSLPDSTGSRPVPPHRTPKDTQPLAVGVNEEETLIVSEDSQGPTQPCECHLQTRGTSCPACSGEYSWVMVSYKLGRLSSEKPQRKPRKRRGPLEREARLQTVHTRDMGACIRCKIQRVRCLPDPVDSTAPCQACSRVRQNLSRKVIHHIVCHRYKLREVVLFRTLASNVTNRWCSGEVCNVTTKGRRITVAMMQEFVGSPFSFDVRRVAKTGRAQFHDKTTRDWYDGATVVREPVSDYALADVHQVVSQYKDYIRDSVLGVGSQPSIEKMAAGFWGAPYDTGVAGSVYQKAWEYFCSLPGADETWEFFYQKQAERRRETSSSVSDKAFLLGFFELQFALRHATGWSWILDGGIPDAARIKQFPPLRGRVSTPRLVVGQIDCIRITSVLKPLARSIMNVLTVWISEGQYEHWMTIFFATFILLVEVAKATEDAYHHGWYDKEIRRAGPKNAHMIRDLHETANIVLAYWHYFNCGVNPLRLSGKPGKPRSRTPLRSLSADQLATVQQIWVAMSQWRERPCTIELYGNDKDEGWWKEWCHSMYFADQMVDLKWSARPVFT